MISVLKRRVAFHETDCMGVVHHAVYAKFFEEARVEFLYINGLEKYHAPKVDFILAVLSLEVKYFRPLKVSDLFDVKISITLEGVTKIQFCYEIYLDKTLITKGKTLHVGLNSRLKVIKPPKELIKGIKEYGS